MVGTMSDVLGAEKERERVAKASARDLAAQALGLVGVDMGVPVLQA